MHTIFFSKLKVIILLLGLSVETINELFQSNLNSHEKSFKCADNS